MGIQEFYHLEPIGKYQDNGVLPDPDLLIYYQNLDNRTIWIDTDINEGTLSIVKMILLWNEEDRENKVPVAKRKKIKLFFYSVGGDIEVNNSLIDVIQMSKTPVIGVNAGICMSAAASIYLACHKRYVFPNAKFLLHQGSGAMNGTYRQIVSAVVNYQEEVKAMERWILSRTKIPEDILEENFNNEDWYIGAKEAIKYGIADKIIKKYDMLTT